MSKHRALSRRTWLRLLSQTGMTAILSACQAPIGSEQPTPIGVSYANIPRWRGFNLQNKYNYENLAFNRAYDEWHLDFMVEFGFDFIRLPTDYRIWTQSPGVYRELVLKEIDQLIEWARQRKIHVCLCLHRAPGYCVNPPAEPFDLWGFDRGSDIAGKQFIEQWNMFAMRYKHIPGEELSFTLINEPPQMTRTHYIQLIHPSIEAIRKHNPQPLIIADGSNYGRWTVPELVKLQVAQSTRGYEPFLLSHYRASWVKDADQYPTPVWPIPAMLNHYLYGDIKRDFKRPLILMGSFPEAAEFRIHINQVSTQADLVISADGQPILQYSFKPGPGQGEWKQSVFQTEWNNYLATYDQELVIRLPAQTQEIRVELGYGDWLTFSNITVDPFPGAHDGKLVIHAADTQWAVRQESFRVDSSGGLSLLNGELRFSQESLWRDYVDPWQAFSEQQHIGVMVGEWGAYNHTPHAVVLAWMQDCLANWKRANMGWALWELDGSFGVLNSKRADVQYEDYKGHKLDRKMLELLRQG